jgi:hypothetical protein
LVSLQLGHDRGQVEKAPSAPRLAVVELPQADTWELNPLASSSEPNEVPSVSRTGTPTADDAIVGGELIVQDHQEAFQC